MTKHVVNHELQELADEAVQLELNVSYLYMIFKNSSTEDAEFWWQLVVEENNHAALIKSGREYFMQVSAFPRELLPPAIAELQAANREIKSLVEKYDADPPTREEAFNIALKAEMSAGEIHFQQAMSKSADSRIMRLFQDLNEDDKDHIKRIRAYMNENGIEELA